MLPIEWRPFRELERFFEEDWIPFVPVRHRFEPAVDVYETDKEVIVETSLAGFKPEEIEVEAEDDYVTIKGETKEEKEEKKKNYYRREVRRGNFVRTVALPATVKSAKAKAEFKDGMLKITLPKEAVPKKKKVKVVVKK